MSTPHDATRSFSPIDAVIAAYLQAAESGSPPDRLEFLAQHPTHAESLRAFFEDLDRMDQAASPLRLDGDAAASDPSTNGAPGTVRYFGDYELLQEVARGGMGIVYRARQVSLNRVVALKMVLAGGHATPQAMQRFRIEAEAAANLDHPSIVPIYEVGEHEGLQYFSMKFVDGTSLAHHPGARPGRRSPASSPWRGASTTRTSTACCTATSSPRTSWWTRKATASSPTSASPSACPTSTKS